MARYEGKVAFVTGGAVGFGRAFARALLAEGASVVLADVAVDAARDTVTALDPTGARALAVDCDVADEDQVAVAVQESVAHFGGIDVLVNNAGLHLMEYNQPFAVLERAKLRRLLDVNVVGIVNCTLACRASMAERGGGAVLNISSMAGHMSTTPYGVSKLAVRGLTVALATELAPDSIRVNAISPGLMATENAVADLPPELVEHMVERTQLIHRLGEMDDIVRAMLYLCSDDASFVTGETLKVSGGTPLYL
jgi:NAD(P)-dependent dehydrogenase (short-subunit alcohol dehydrogenase family)